MASLPRILALAGLLASSSALAGSFVINEIVADPQTDWNGDSSVTDSDEFIEIKNTSASDQSLGQYVLEMNDGTSDTDVLDPNQAGHHAEHYLLFDSSGAQVSFGSPIVVPAGGYLVLLNPAGTLNTTGTINLLDPAGDPEDTVIYSANADSPANEAFARFPDGTDTNSDAADFVLRGGTLGKSNGTFCTIADGAALINEVIGDPKSDWNGSGAVDGDHDEYIEIKNATAGPLDLRGCVLDMTDTTPDSFLFQELDSPTTPVVKVYDSAGNQVGTAPQLASVPAGGYVVVLDPPGQMNSTGTVDVVLRNGKPSPATTIDSVSVTLGANSAADESSSRFPDGGDTIIQKKGTPGRTNGTGSVGTVHKELINEVILTPAEDYDGDGVVNTSDQAIELYNASGQTIDLTGWKVNMIDTSPVCDKTIGSAFKKITFSAGGTLDAWKAGEYLTLIHPSAQMNKDVDIKLIDFQGHVVDDVEIGGNKATTDFKGNGAGNGAPGDGGNGEAVGIGDSSIARVPNATDTDNDVNDFARQEPTLGLTNNISRNDSTAPTVDHPNSTSGSNFAITHLPQLSFSEAIATNGIDESLVILRRSGAPADEIPPAQSLLLTNQDKTVVIVPRGALLPGTTYTIEVATGITDRAGNTLAATGVVSTFTTEAAAANPASTLRINEAVVDPQRDWKGTFFKEPNAPQGNNTSLDEWVEFYNAGSSTLDLSLWTLEILGSSRYSVQLGDTASGRLVTCWNNSGTLIGDDGSTCFKALAPGSYLVLGDPPGSMGNDVFLALRNASGALIDTVEIGGNTASSDYGGNGVNNGAPAAQDGAALGLYDEAVARVPNATDTGNNLTDWTKQRATLGRSNDLTHAPDSTPPAVQSLVITRQVGSKTRADTDLLLTFNEPMDLRGINEESVRLTDSNSGATVALKFDFGLNDTQALIHWSNLLEFGHTYKFVVRGREVGVHDQAGNALPQDVTYPFTVESAPAPATGLLINEVVSAPQQDWDDSLCGPGLAFDANIGLKIASSADEWIELYNKGGQANFSGWTISMKDSDFTEHLLGSTADNSVERYSGAGGNGTILAGGYYLLGDPPNSMLDTVYVELRNPSGVLVDYVYVRGASSDTSDEAYARFPNGGDTNSDIIDFANMRATPLGQNSPGVTPPVPAQRFDVLLTQVVVDPQSDWDDSGCTAGLPFDSQPCTSGAAQVSTSDEYIQLANVSTKAIKLTGWTLSMVDTSPAIYVIGSDPGIEHYSSGASADYFPRGARLTIGNPPGSMNNSVFIVLEDARGKLIDKVEIGDVDADHNFESDDDRDGKVDEDRIDGNDNDGDGLIDEDPPGPDPLFDGIPKKGDGNATSPANEAFSRAKKTGVDQQDWTRGRGTPGQVTLNGLLQLLVPSAEPWLVGSSLLLCSGLWLLRRGRIRRRSTKT